MKHIKLFENFLNEGKMPDKYIGNDEIVYLKTKEDSKGANYNLYYKGHDIEKGGVRFGSKKELEDFASNYILSNQLYRKLRYEDSIPLPESFLNESNLVEFRHKGKKIKVDMNTVEIEGIDMGDYPDFVDAFFSYAEDHRGRELTEEELDAFNDAHYDLTNEIIHDQQLYL